MKNMYEMMMSGELMDRLKKSTTRTTVLCSVIDEDGNTVEIVRDVAAEGGEELSNSLIAQYPDGTLYPAESSQIVLSTMKEANGK